MKAPSIAHARCGAICLCAALLCLPTSAWSATPAAEELPAVVVTSEKIAQPIQQVPASVSVMGGQEIKHTGTTDFHQLQAYISNASISLSPDSGQFSIRGFATPDSNPGFDPSVGTVIDGVFYNRPQFLSAFFYDIGSFQVLRGPQGTLFGKNASAGVFELHTAAPRNRPMFRMEYLMSSDGGRSLRPVGQIGIGNTLSIRAAANIEHGDRGVLYNTYLHRGERNTNQDSARVRLRYTPTAALVVDMEAFVSLQRRHNNIFKLYKVTPRMKQFFRQYDPNIQFGLDNNKNSANTPSENVDDIRGVVANVSYDLAPPWAKSGATLHNIVGFAQARTSRRDIDADFSPVPFVQDTLARPSPYRQFSEEFRINGHAPNLFGFGHKLTYVGGLYFFRSTFDISNIYHIQNLAATLNYILAANPNLGNGQLPAGLGGVLGGVLGGLTGVKPVQDIVNVLAGALGQGEQSAVTGLSQVDESYATYGQFQWFFVPHWSIIAGIRLGLEHKTGNAFSHTDSLIIPSISGQQNFAQNLSELEREISPKFGFQWSPNRHTSAYLTWTRGYKSGGFNAIALNPDHLRFGPERADNYELGYKTLTRVWGRPLSVAADLFWTRFRNLQVSTLQQANFVTLNAASARSRGFEADVQWLPFRHASLRVSAGLADAEYIHYPNAPATIPQTQKGQQTQDLSGRPLAFAPRWKFAITPGYTLPLPFSIKAHGYFDLLYKSGRYLDIDDDRQNKYQGGVTTMNARLIFTEPAGHWAVGLVAHNITNRVLIDQVVNQPEAPGDYAAVRTDRGRYYTADLTITFK